LKDTLIVLGIVGGTLILLMGVLLAILGDGR
jgi:hypothetical protein